MVPGNLHPSCSRSVVIASFAALVFVLAACQPALDRSPDPFSFPVATGVEPGAVVTSDSVVVAGVNAPASLEVEGGDAVALVDGVVVSSGAVVSAGDEVQVRLTASGSFSSTVTATVTIGGVSAEFSVTTRAADGVVDGFSFVPVVDAEVGVVYTSSVVTVSGVDVPVPVSVLGDASAVLVVDGVDVVGPVDVVLGDEVQVRLTSSAAYATAVSATVSIDGESADFVVTTKDAPVAPVVVSFDAAVASVLWGDEDVALSWSVSGDVDRLVLTNDYDASVVDVAGLSGVLVTVPSDVPSVEYTLTASNDELAVSDSGVVSVGVELWVCEDPADVVTFVDGPLEQALRDETAVPGVGPITCADLQGLTEFASGAFLVEGGPDVLGGIVSLAGLQHAVNLEVLDLQVNLIEDVTPLANLSALRELTLDLNPVGDLAPLAGLTELTYLSLWFLQERDVAAFPYATPDYDSASCGQAGIDDLSALAGLVNVTELDIAYNAVTDLGPLAGMDGLELVLMVCNGVGSFAPLVGKENLAVVWASDNVVDDAGFAAVASWSGLQWLRLDYNRVSDVGPLGALPGLYAVGLEGNFLGSVAALADNLDFPGVAGALPVTPPPVPTLSIGFNCLDAGVGSVASADVAVIEGRGATVVGFDAVQRGEEECAATAP